MPTNATRLSDRQLKAVKATGKDFVLSDGDGLQLRVRASGLTPQKSSHYPAASPHKPA